MEAIKTKACNALLLKVNQIGTVTESIEAALLSQVYLTSSTSLSYHLIDLIINRMLDLVSWSPTDQEKPKIPSSLTLLLVSLQDKSRQELLADQSVSPSTIRFSELSKKSVLRVYTQGNSSEIPLLSSELLITYFTFMLHMTLYNNSEITCIIECISLEI